MNENIDLKSQVQKSQLFTEIDNIVNGFYKTVNDKKIEIKTPKDLERIDRFFIPTLKKLIKLVESNKTYDGFILNQIKNTVIVDFFIRFFESRGLDPSLFIPHFGKEEVKIFEKALRDMKTTMG